MSFAV